MKQLYIIDGYFFLYRARHAYPAMSNRDGLATNMIFGFYRMLCNLLMQKPDNMIIARDAHGSVKREELLPSYKANRTTMPDDFRNQVRLCKVIANEIGLKSIEVPGYEADDIIYSIAKSNRCTDDRIHFIYSADKDLKQVLECNNIVIRDPIKDEERTKAKFIKEWGFEPARIVDYLSLVGDASDNVPGARGIGPKGASDLVQKRGTIENMYDNLNLLTDKQRELLEISRDDVYRAKKLIELYDVPNLELDLSESFKPDFVKRKEVLVKQYHLSSFEKTMDDLKKQWYFTQDGGLFC